jgi:hypothetical protein
MLQVKIGLLVLVTVLGMAALTTDDSSGDRVPRSMSLEEVRLIDFHGCHRFVCLDLLVEGGRGLDVNQIVSSTKEKGPYTCIAEAVLYVNNIEVSRQQLPCANGWTHYWTRPWAPRTYRDGDTICTRITTRPGKPCAKVHT